MKKIDEIIGLLSAIRLELVHLVLAVGKNESSKNFSNSGIVSYYRVYDSCDREIFASKELSNCLDFVKKQNSVFLHPATVRKLIYSPQDGGGSFVMCNELVEFIS